MLGKVISAVAGRSIARTVGGAAAGPAGAVVGMAVPVILPRVARTLGPLGMVAAAVGGVLFTRWLERRNTRKEAEAKALGSMQTNRPEAILGGSTPPDLLEGELLKD